MKIVEYYANPTKVLNTLSILHIRLRKSNSKLKSKTAWANFDLFNLREFEGNF